MTPDRPGRGRIGKATETAQNRLSLDVHNSLGSGSVSAFYIKSTRAQARV